MCGRGGTPEGCPCMLRDLPGWGRMQSSVEQWKESELCCLPRFKSHPGSCQLLDLDQLLSFSLLQLPQPLDEDST